MNGEPAPEKPDRSTSLAESPLFWLLLFGLMALAAILVIGPKFSKRQSRLEANYQGREQVWKHKLTGSPIDSVDYQPEEVAPRTTPLLVTLGLPLLAVIYLVAFVLWRRRTALQ